MPTRPARAFALAPFAAIPFAFACLIASPGAFAGCLSHPSQGIAQPLSFGTVSVPADAPVGAVIAERTTAAWNSPAFKCVKPRRTGSLGLFNTPAAGGDNVHATNLPGVGIRVYFFNSSYGERVLPEREFIPWTFKAQLTNAHFRVQLVKTGPIPEGGSLLYGTLARAGYDDQAQVRVDLVQGRVEPQRPTCAFAARRLVFALGKVDARDLAVAGSSAWVTRSLVVTGCTGATQMLMTFRGTPDARQASLFQLGGPGAAGGVAVELRSVDPDVQAIPNSPAPLVLPAQREGQSFGFRARYRTTGAPLVPGTANARITVNVAYR
ncbi:fimbrial protein [Xanthomonas sp. NCPPB 2632]|jgi:type 1 fimbria pilin|uniref:fimbrial protein n=1 Tax=Xanthomonas sp. NCPPB 2632 TaxID=3240912 RepID=UPI003514D6D5